MLLALIQSNPSLPESVQQTTLDSAKQSIVQVQASLAERLSSSSRGGASQSGSSSVFTDPQIVIDCAPGYILSGSSCITQTANGSAKLSASPASGAAPLSVHFTGSVNSAGYSIEFGDGQTSGDIGCSNGGCPVGNGPASVNVSHMYSIPGTYTAKLRAHASTVAANCYGRDCNVVGTASVTVTDGASQTTLPGLNVDCVPGYLWNGIGCVQAASSLSITADNYVGTREVPAGSSATIRWSAGNVKSGSCSVTGDGNYTGWPQTEFSPDYPAGGLSTGPIYGGHTWTLSCIALDGSKVSSSVTVTLPVLAQ